MTYALFSLFRTHQTRYEKSDWSTAFNQFTVACELDTINAISAADVAFQVCLVTKPLELFSSETEWLNSSPLFVNVRMYNKTIIEFGFRMISRFITTSCLYYMRQSSASADNTDLCFDNSWYHAQPHPIIV